MKSQVVFLSVVAFLFLSGMANTTWAKTSAKKEPGKTVPTYEDVVKTYPDGVHLCETEADIVGGNDQQLSLGGGYISVNEDGEQRYQCYGTKLTVRKKVTLRCLGPLATAQFHSVPQPVRCSRSTTRRR